MEFAVKNKGLIHTIVFDLDGTLVDTALLTLQAFRLIAPGMGLKVQGVERIRTAIGYANPEFYYHIYPDQPQERVFQFGRLVEREELRLLPHMNHMLLFPGCLELLTELREKHISLYIASTGSEEHVSAVIP